jgi:alanine dehydrogenase
MLIGAPREIKVREYRVGLLPANVRELTDRGHRVVVETDEGVGIGASDAAYEAAGAAIVPNVTEVIHYCVANMPGAVPRASTYAPNNATLPYVLVLADRGVDVLKNDPHLLNGLTVHKGMMTSKPVAQALRQAFVPPLKALAA